MSLAFPPADIDRIQEMDLQEHSGYEITANFLGLYGISSPLPTFYTEELMHEAAEDESVCRDFIDVINQRCGPTAPRRRSGRTTAESV
ncbi:MAG: type VI secretion system baseplate subunit TssG [Desulfosalsimonadaceae bacterium]